MMDTVVQKSQSHAYRKWIGVLWLMLESNLMSANIYGFSAIFKVLPKYGIYDHYCQSSNATNGLELNCQSQIKQYQVDQLLHLLNSWSCSSLELIVYLESINSGYYLLQRAIDVRRDCHRCVWMSFYQVIWDVSLLIHLSLNLSSPLFSRLLHIFGWLAMALLEPGLYPDSNSIHRATDRIHVCCDCRSRLPFIHPYTIHIAFGNYGANHRICFIELFFRVPSLTVYVIGWCQFIFIDLVFCLSSRSSINI